MPPRALEYRYIGIVVVPAFDDMYCVTTKSSIESAKTISMLARIAGSEQRQQDQPQRRRRRRAEVARRLLVLRADRGEPAAHDHDDVGERERDLADDLRRRAEVHER